MTTIATPVNSKTKLIDRLPEWARNFVKNRKALSGFIILFIFVLVAIFANQIAPVDPVLGPNKMVAPPNQPPSSEHWLGTTGNGQDVFTQLVHGTRRTLFTAFVTAAVIVAIATLMGITPGFIGGAVDDVLSLVTNVFLVLPSLPLMIVVAAWVSSSSPYAMMVVLSITGWAYGARIVRSASLAIRNSEYVQAAKVIGESNWHIIVREILPNLYSLMVSFYINAVTMVILSMASLEFLGLGNPTAISWGMILYWAQNNSALLRNAWWTFVPPGICIGLVGFSLILINYGVDELTNPNLKTD